MMEKGVIGGSFDTLARVQPPPIGAGCQQFAMHISYQNVVHHGVLHRSVAYKGLYVSLS